MIVKWHSVAWPYTITPPSIWLYTKSWPYYRTWPFNEVLEVFMEHLWWVWHGNRGCSLLLTPNLRLAYVLLVETNLFPKLVLILSSPEPKAQVSLCRRPPSVVRPSLSILKLSYFNFFSRTAWWILMKLCRDEVLMVPYKCISVVIICLWLYTSVAICKVFFWIGRIRKFFRRF